MNHTDGVVPAHTKPMAPLVRVGQELVYNGKKLRHTEYRSTNPKFKYIFVVCATGGGYKLSEGAVRHALDAANVQETASSPLFEFTAAELGEEVANRKRCRRREALQSLSDAALARLIEGKLS